MTLQAPIATITSILFLFGFCSGCEEAGNSIGGSNNDDDNNPVEDTALYIDTDSDTDRDQENSDYFIGSGIYDVTGPAAEIGMMGFADINQKTSGIHMRLWSRAFIVVDPVTEKRVVFVSADILAIMQAVNQGVIAKLKDRFGDLYTEKNVLLTATHSHSGPGGYSHYFLYNATVLGFIRDNYDVIVNGIFQSVINAHNNLQPGRILIAKDELHNANWNRSVSAYENNPEAEILDYENDVDKSVTLLKFVTDSGEEIGMINWFAVHPTSIGPSNTLITGDNMGLAEYLFEKRMGTDYSKSKTFVAAWAQSNSGDVSPNIPWGPAGGSQDYEHMEIVARRMYDKAVDLYDSAMEEISGPVDYRHKYVDFSDLYIEEEGLTTCKAAMGASFSAGSSEDNASPFPLFPEGTTRDDVDWSANMMQSFLAFFLPGIQGIIWPTSLSPSYIDCHAEKPILLPTGKAHWNFAIPGFFGQPIYWTPQILPVQLIRIGNLIILGQPSEITTMAGRRLRNIVAKSLVETGIDYAVLSSLANAYSSYVSTREEYAMQHYEGASTHFGPFTLKAYQQEYRAIADAMRDGLTNDPGPLPRNLSADQHNFQPGVIFDDTPLFKNFGDVKTGPDSYYTRGSTVKVVFWGAHPRNNLKTQDTFLKIEKVATDNISVLEVVANDWNPETRYRWRRNGAANSLVTIEWEIPDDIEPGTYRISHFGSWRSFWTTQISEYQGTSDVFRVE